MALGRRSRPDPSPPDPRPDQPSGADIDPTALRSREDRPARVTPESRQLLNALDRRSERSGRLSPLTYNLTVSHGLKFMYFEVAKVATRTVTYHLLAHDVPLDLRGALRIRYPTAAFADYRTFSVVRHPQDRLVSAWRDKVVGANYYRFDDRVHAQMQEYASFVGWVADQDLSDLEASDQHIVRQSRLVDLTRVDIVGRLEHFDVDFPRICRAIGVPAPEDRPRRLNASTGPELAVSRATSDLVIDLYRRDFEIFGYTPY